MFQQGASNAEKFDYVSIVESFLLFLITKGHGTFLLTYFASSK